MNSRIEPLTVGARHSPLTQLVVEALRERILTGKVQSGERLVEGRLSEELGVSRMPVREALHTLAAEGLVTIEPRRGASVTSFGVDQVRELVEVRATLEGLNAKLAAKRHDPAQLAALEKILEEGTRLADSEDVAKMIQLGLEYAPAPPFDSGRPEAAQPHILAGYNALLAPRMAQARQRAATLDASFDMLADASCSG